MSLLIGGLAFADDEHVEGGVADVCLEPSRCYTVSLAQELPIKWVGLVSDESNQGAIGSTGVFGNTALGFGAHRMVFL